MEIIEHLDQVGGHRVYKIKNEHFGEKIEQKACHKKYQIEHPDLPDLFSIETEIFQSEKRHGESVDGLEVVAAEAEKYHKKAVYQSAYPDGLRVVVYVEKCEGANGQHNVADGGAAELDESFYKLKK